MQSLVCFGLKSHLGTVPVSDFQDFVDLDNWSGAPVRRVEVPSETGVDGVVFLIQSVPREPDWASFIREGLGEEVRISSTPTPGALILVRVSVESESRYFAFTFGSGRHLLRTDSYHRRFGLRIALNAVFEGDTVELAAEATRLRSVDAKRVSSKTVRMRHQATQIADFETFDVDRNRDFLRGVTGVPRQPQLWGRNITGADSLTVNRELSFGELPDFCLQLASTHAEDSYRHRFGWVDDVRLVMDAHHIKQLEDLLSVKLRSENLDDMELNIPEIVDWDRVSRFILPTQARTQVEHLELRLVDYVSAMRTKNLLATLDSAKLQAQRIRVVDGAGDEWNSWSVWQCLTAELSFEGRRFILDEGDFYEISDSFLSQLDADIRRLVPESTLALPQANVRWNEDAYNRHAALTGLLLLDKRTVRVPGSTSQVEICDLLSGSRQLVHVKRKLGSSLLSHLFAQGHISADLYQTSREFREVAGQMVQRVLAEPDVAGLAPDSVDLFDTEVPSSSVEVVYAIVANWRNRSFVDALPFFSKVNLRQHASDLRRRGFNVTHSRVQTHS